jgi:hypothetical protein
VIRSANDVFICTSSATFLSYTLPYNRVHLFLTTRLSNILYSMLCQTQPIDNLVHSTHILILPHNGPKDTIWFTLLLAIVTYPATPALLPLVPSDMH